MKNKKQIIDLRDTDKKNPVAKTQHKNKNFKKIILEWVIYIAVFALIVLGTPKLLTKILNSEYPIASITSSSMWPVIKRGDIVFIKGVNGKSDIKLGDIVVYNNEKGFTIHRIVKLNEDTFITRGDANNVDDQPVKYEELIGKTINIRNKPLRLPYLGNLSQIFFKSPSPY
jgi:signal peptidase